MTGGRVLSIQTCISISSSGMFIIFQLMLPVLHMFQLRTNTLVNFYFMQIISTSRPDSSPATRATSSVKSRNNGDNLLRPGLRPRPPRASVVASKLSESQYANFDCRNVSRSERPHFAYEGTIEYYQHYMQALGLENINIYQARPHSHIYFTGQSTSQHSQLLVGFF